MAQWVYVSCQHHSFFIYFFYLYFLYNPNPNSNPLMLTTVRSKDKNPS